jgi:hypothetical protein
MQCRLWAVAAETMGDALYRDYARQLAEYSTVKAFEHSSTGGAATVQQTAARKSA